ncbi:MAG: translation elongation factor-like protein [Candidatus Micrarchaeota archaeon]|nr:translation elongation factor-like protein [Candidatus Micrarchaeota archaeon]
MEKKLVGKIAHFFGKIGVAVVDLSGELRNGDRIAIEGPGGVVEQVVDSMQINKEPVESAGRGESVGLKVDSKVREGDVVYILSG